MRIRRSAAALVTAIVVGGSMLFAAPSASAATASPGALVTADGSCRTWTSEPGSPSTVTVTGAVGDTFTVTFSGIPCAPIQSFESTDSTVTPAGGDLDWGTVSTFTIVGSGTVRFVGGAPGLLSINVVATSVVSTPMAAPPAPTPPPWAQSTERGDQAASCPTGWGQSWAQWPHGNTGGWVCVRTLVHRHGIVVSE